jgi:hypothetical protein
VLSIAPDSAKNVPTAHLWIWCVVGTFVYCVWVIAIQQVQEGTERAVQKKNITAADYSVLLSNLGGSTGNDAILEDFGRHFGEVVMAFHIRTLGQVLHKCNEVRACLFAPFYVHPSLCRGG